MVPPARSGMRLIILERRQSPPPPLIALFQHSTASDHEPPLPLRPRPGARRRRIHRRPRRGRQKAPGIQQRLARVEEQELEGFEELERIQVERIEGRPPLLELLALVLEELEVVQQELQIEGHLVERRRMENVQQEFEAYLVEALQGQLLQGYLVQALERQLVDGQLVEGQTPQPQQVPQVEALRFSLLGPSTPSCVWCEFAGGALKSHCNCSIRCILFASICSSMFVE